jgi:uncharacterized membrane protein HdeD (DUF308 family)
MKSLFLTETIDIPAFIKNWIWFFLWGMILIILGVCAIGAATFTTLLSVVFLGFIILISGMIIILDSFTFWRKRKGFLLHLLMGILYIVVGFMLINSPLAGSISLTLLLGLFYLVLGLFRLYYSFSLRAPRWGWNFFNGLISALLGMLILMSWPESSLYIIGLFVGIDLLFCGWAYVMAALGAKSMLRS